MRFARFGAVAALAAALCQTASAQVQDVGQIGRAKALLARAGAALVDARGEEPRLAALGRAVTAHEAALSALRTGLRAMAAAERGKADETETEAAKLRRLLSALQSLSRAPASALLTARGGPLDATRSAMLMAGIMPELDRRVAALDQRLKALQALRTDQEAARADARATLAALQDLRARTAEALGRRDRAGLPARRELRRQAKAAAASARDLDSLAAALRTAGISAGSAFRPAPLPVAGQVSARFGEPDPWGRPGHGWTIDAPAFAQVTAPWDATLRYAGPLTDYKQVVVLEPEAGYLLVLAGLANIVRNPGEAVLAGEKLGDLGGMLPFGDQFLLEDEAGSGQIRHERLYVELRRAGKPLDPAGWFDVTGSEELR